jgi:hypothetical protein
MSIPQTPVHPQASKLDLAIQKLAVYVKLAEHGIVLLSKKGYLTPELNIRIRIEAEFAMNILVNVFMVSKEGLSELFELIINSPQFQEEVYDYCEAVCGRSVRTVLVTPTQYEKELLNRGSKQIERKRRRH